MLLKSDFIKQNPRVTQGSVVKSQDGEKLGKIAYLDEDSFVVEKGLFFPKDFFFRYEDITDVRDGEVVVNTHQSDLSEWRERSYSGWSQIEDVNTGRLQTTPKEEFRERYPDWGEEEVRMPVLEEELKAQKTVRQAGQVQLRKIVHTELKHFTVPVMREDVVVERVPASEATADAIPSEGAFKEKTIVIPLVEEDVTVTKQPVVKEEVRVHKRSTTENRDVSDEVRKEEVQIDEDVPGKPTKRK